MSIPKTKDEIPRFLTILNKLDFFENISPRINKTNPKAISPKKIPLTPNHNNDTKYRVIIITIMLSTR